MYSPEVRIHLSTSVGHGSNSVMDFQTHNAHVFINYTMVTTHDIQQRTEYVTMNVNGNIKRWMTVACNKYPKIHLALLWQPLLIVSQSALP